MMCVASGSALSIATFGLFPLAGLDVSPVASKPNSQSHVNILQVTHNLYFASAKQASGLLSAWEYIQVAELRLLQCRLVSHPACNICICCGQRTDRAAAQVWSQCYE